MATTILLWAVAVGLFYSIIHNIMKMRKQTQESQDIPTDEPTDAVDKTDKIIQEPEPPTAGKKAPSFDFPNFVLSVNGKESIIEVGNSLSTDYSKDAHEKKRHRLKLREQRRERKYFIWEILRYMISRQELANSSDFYNLRKTLVDYNNSLERLNNDVPSNEHFEIAFRFCQSELYKGKCNHALTKDEMQIIRDWRTQTLNIKEILEKVANSYMEYWDEVLASYKRPSARTDRLKYLDEKLDEFSKWPEIQSIEGANNTIHQLRQHYSNMLAT